MLEATLPDVRKLGELCSISLDRKARLQYKEHSYVNELLSTRCRASNAYPQGKLNGHLGDKIYIHTKYLFLYSSHLHVDMIDSK
jgi:hypothetical protein